MLLVAAATMAAVAGTTEAASARPENSMRPGTFARGLPLDRTLSFVRPEELNFVFPSDGVNAQPWKEDGPIRFFRRDHGFVRGHLVSYRRDVQLPAEYVFSVRSYVGLYRKAAQAKWELRHAAELYFPHRTVEISEPPNAYVGDQTVELKTTEAAHSTAIVFRRGRYTAAVLAAGAQTFPELSAVETLAGFVDDRIRGHL